MNRYHYITKATPNFLFLDPKASKQKLAEYLMSLSPEERERVTEEMSAELRREFGKIKRKYKTPLTVAQVLKKQKKNIRKEQDRVATLPKKSMVPVMLSEVENE